MPQTAPKTAEEITEGIRALVDRVVEARFTQEMAKRATEVGTLASEAWSDSEPARRDAAKRLAQATDDAAKWSDVTWRSAVRPLIKQLWSRRTAAIGAAGAAAPAGKALVETAAVRLGLKEQQREARHWGAFFLGLVLGAIGGAIVAMLTTPKPGSEIRQALGERADDLAARADELATRAKDEWVPMFQRDDPTNGHVDEVADEIGETASDVTATAAEEAESFTDASAAAADETAEAINDAFDTAEKKDSTS